MISKCDKLSNEIIGFVVVVVVVDGGDFVEPDPRDPAFIPQAPHS